MYTSSVGFRPIQPQSSSSQSDFSLSSTTERIPDVLPLTPTPVRNPRPPLLATPPGFPPPFLSQGGFVVGSEICLWPKALALWYFNSSKEHVLNIYLKLPKSTVSLFLVLMCYNYQIFISLRQNHRFYLLPGYMSILNLMAEKPILEDVNDGLTSILTFDKPYSVRDGLERRSSGFFSHTSYHCFAGL